MHYVADSTRKTAKEAYQRVAILVNVKIEFQPALSGPFSGFQRYDNSYINATQKKTYDLLYEGLIQPP